MVTITLDTNLLIELFDLGIDPKSVPGIGTIFRHAFDHHAVDLKITTTVTEDLMRDKDKSRMEAMKFRIDNAFSVLGAGYVTVDFLPEDEAERRNFQELQRVLFPNLNKTDRRYQNKLNDVHHLHRHIRARRSAFVTNDRDILKKKGELNAAFGAIVMDPAECARYLDAQDLVAKYPIKKHPARTDYYSPELSGEVRFNFENNDSSYRIGAGDMIFDTKWSECFTDRMHAYNDSIEALAVAEGVSRFQDVLEFQFYDSTSRSRKVVKDKDILILKNSRGFFAAIKITDIQLKSRGASKNELAFKYVIQPNKSSSFKELTK